MLQFSDLPRIIKTDKFADSFQLGDVVWIFRCSNTSLLRPDLFDQISRDWVHVQLYHGKPWGLGAEIQLQTKPSITDFTPNTGYEGGEYGGRRRGKAERMLCLLASVRADRDQSKVVYSFVSSVAGRSDPQYELC